MNENVYSRLFMQLVLQNKQMAMISMGKLKNPVTDQVEKNLEYAKLSIDILDMLLNKTKGNLSEYEEKFLTETLSQLKINYVEESGKKDKTNDEMKKEDKGGS